MAVVSIVVGDRWGDGHGRYETFSYEVDDIATLSDAKHELLKDYGIDFSSMADDYQDSSIPVDMFEKIKDLGVEYEGCIYEEKDRRPYFDCSDGYVTFFVRCLQYLYPDLRMEPVKKAKEIELGGYGFFD